MNQRSYLLTEASEIPDRMSIHPSTQEATAVKLWRNAQWVSSEALAKEDALRRVPPKTQEGPRLPVLRSSLLRRMDQAVGLHFIPSWSEKGVCPLLRPFPLLKHYSQVVDAVRSTGRNLPCEDVKGGVMAYSMARSAPRQLCSMRRGKRVCASLHRCTNSLFDPAGS